ncbi:MAG: TRAP transporter small permease [Lachnospiraceae bacterium]|nr:TRAP transporter small permease [Lachnospiraceae bacterium]
MNLYYNEKKFYNHLEEWCGAFLLAVMLVLLFAQVVSRYIFKASAAWISEYALYMFMYFTFLACSGAFLRNDHIQIVAVLELMPRKIRSIVYIILQFVNAVFAGYVGYYTFLRVVDQFQMNSLSITQFPLWIMSTSLLLGMTGSVIRCTANIYFQIRYEWIQPGTKEANL